MGIKNKRAVYVNISDDQVYEWDVSFCCFFLKARNMNGVDFEILIRTPVP